LNNSVNKRTNALIIALRVLVIALCFVAFAANFNPARVSTDIPGNASLFTVAVSYSSSIGTHFVRAVNMSWISQGTLVLIYAGALITGLGVLALAGAACMSMGNNKLRRLGTKISLSGCLGGIAGTSLLLAVSQSMLSSPHASRINPVMPFGIYIFYALFVLLFVIGLLLRKSLPEPTGGEKYAMDGKYRLFLMIMPFLVLVTLFAYLPLWGWRYAFFDYRAGFALSMDEFVGFKWFRYLFDNEATRMHIARVLRNTFALSGIGIATSWLPMIFAIFLAEIKANRPRKAVQTLTTIPNFISWVLVYSVAFAIFSTEGFLNWMLMNLGLMEEGTNHLMSNTNIWLKMWLWGTWKGLGWSAIIYIAGISSIDPQLYEAAKADGAGRFRRMWHVTIPGLMPTFFVLLILAIANMLSNGLEQYLVFYNPANRATIEVLDLYVYNLGIGATTSQTLPLATVIGMFKSVISVTLLFAANKFSKWVRGESIV
jgi:putative aldouronate transport system permease protein